MLMRGLCGALWLAVVALAAGGFVANVDAKTYRCTQPNGAVVIQDRPCPPPPVVFTPDPRPCTMSDGEWQRATTREHAFLARFRTPAAHRTAWQAELEPVVAGLRPMLARLEVLRAERREIDREKAFYATKPLPPWLAAKDDANHAQLAGLALAFARVEDSIRQIVAARTCEIQTFGLLWADGRPGISACQRPAC